MPILQTTSDKHMNIRELLNQDIFDIANYQFTVLKLIIICLIIIGTYFLLWIARKYFKRKAYKKADESGRWLAYYQIIKYILLVAAFAMVLQTIGIKITLLIASSAGLFIGVGIGMQQIFNDLVSGVILLVEGSVRVNDILKIDNEVIKVKKIGIRASEVVNRDDIEEFLPNSHLVSNKIINMSHDLKYTRFIINIGVAYGSNVVKVLELLKEAALEHKEVHKHNPPRARLANFGESSLDFELLFWSSNMFRIRNVKSDIRLNIVKKFEQNNIQIPFPQRDIHIKTN